MIYQEIKPDSPLHDYVQLIWVLEAADSGAYPRTRIVPDGIVELVFHYGTPFHTHTANVTVRQPRSFVISQMHRYIEIEPSGPIGLISVRFFPWGPQHFFECPIQDFLDASVEAADVFGPDMQDVEARLATAETPSARVNIVQDFLRQRLMRLHRPHSIADGVLRLVRSTRGALSVSELARQTGLGQRRLRRVFAASVGAGPKHFSRVTRFLNLCRHLRIHRHKTLTELTYECGYYDQSHFIREFNEFAGLSPRAFFFSRNNVAFTALD